MLFKYTILLDAYDRTISKGENKGDSLGQSIGHAFAYSGGYITGSDIVHLSNQGSFEELARNGLIERYEKLNELTKAEKESMTKAELKAYDRANTVYVATQKLAKLYKEKVDKDAKFAKGNSVKHGLIQRAVYMSADRATRQTFLNEKDLEQMYNDNRNRLKEISKDEDRTQGERLEALDRITEMNDMRKQGEIQLVDFAYRNEAGELCFGEAITENYTQADKDAKGEFVKSLGYSDKSLTFYN